MATIDALQFAAAGTFFGFIAWYHIFGGRQWLANRKALKSAGTKSFRLDVCEP